MREVTVKGSDGVTYKVTVGRIKYGERNEILSKAVRTVLSGGEMKAELDYVVLERELVVKAIRKIEPAVHDIRAFVEELDLDEAQKIVSAVMDLNPLF